MTMTLLSMRVTAKLPTMLASQASVCNLKELLRDVSATFCEIMRHDKNFALKD